MRIRRSVAVCAAFAALVCALLTACGTTTSSTSTSSSTGSSSSTGDSTGASTQAASSEDPLKVTFLYNSDPSAQGWANRFDEARKAAQAKYGDKIATDFKANVPDGPQASPVIESAINDGAKLIIGTSYGQGKPMIEAAKKHPDVNFLVSQFTPPDGLSNFSGFDNAPEDGYYLTGMAAGALSKNANNNRIGYVDAFLIPYDLRQLNAFALGARKTNPDAEVHTVLTNSWTDASKTLSAANSLLSTNPSVLGNPLSDTATGHAANEKGVPWFGGSWDKIRDAGADTFITAPVWNWEPLVDPAVQSVLDNTWKSQYYYLGMKDGAVELAKWGPPYNKLTDDQKAEIDKAMASLKSGETTPFQGPLKSNDGKTVVPAGKSPTVAELESMTWVAPGIEGATLPGA